MPLRPSNRPRRRLVTPSILSPSMKKVLTLTRSDSGPPGLKEEAAMRELREDTRIAISVDGAEVQVDAGLTILSALKPEGFDLPSLCNDVRLERAGGNCGLCVVEVGDERREVKSCINPVRPAW